MTGRTKKQLAKRCGSAIDIAADEVGVSPLQLRRTANARGENGFKKPRGEPLDLRHDPLGHIEAGAVGDMAISPQSMLTRGRSGGIE